MNIITKFFHELLNPHCSHCKEQEDESKFCQSCDTLKMQIEIANQNNARLMSRLLDKPEPIIVDSTPREVTLPKVVPWAVRKQMLETEDRERARAIRNAPKPVDVESVKELEKELDIASTEREAEKA